MKRIIFFISLSLVLVFYQNVYAVQPYNEVDRNIESAIKAKIDSDFDLSTSRILFNVRNGNVTITGVYNYYCSRQYMPNFKLMELVEYICTLQGVNWVRNLNYGNVYRWGDDIRCDKTNLT